MRGRMRVVGTAAAVTGVLALSGCGYEGLNSYTLPGTKGTDGYEVTAAFANMGGLVENQPVLVNDINVGTITDIELDDWTPIVTMTVKKDVVLPANATATIGQTSLLGAKHIQLGPPKTEPAQGRLADGAFIPLERTRNAPETEDVLASVSLLLNGGGLQHIDTISRELNRAMGGRTQDYRALFTELNTFIGGLNEQKGDIIGAVEGLNRLADNLNTGMPNIDKALDTAPQALDVLAKEHDAMIAAAASLNNGWGKVSQPGGPYDKIGQLAYPILTSLEPVLVALADSGESAVEALKYLPTIFFPLDGIGASFKGDQPMFSSTVVDLTLPSIDKNFLTGTPFEGVLTDADRFLEVFSGQAGNPLTAPISGAGVPLTDLGRAPSQLLGGLLGSLAGGN